MKAIEFDANEKITEKVLYERVKPLMEELRSKEVGCRLISSIDKSLIHKLLILFENDGFFVDKDNNVIIWDKKAARKYEAQINSICKLNCERTEKGMCRGCMEYVATTRLNAHFVTEQLILSVA